MAISYKRATSLIARHFAYTTRLQKVGICIALELSDFRMPGSAWHCLPKRPGHVEDDADDRPGKAGAFPTQITVVRDTNPDDDGQ